MRRAAVLVIMLLLPSTARAQISVLGLEADPGAQKVAKWVTTALRTWVKSKGMALGPAKDLLEVKAVFGCERERAKCMAGIARTMKVRKLIFGKVKYRNRRYVVILKMLDMRSPQNLDTVTQTMSRSDATRSAVRAAAARWAAKLTGAATMGKLRVVVRPSGAMVAVDRKDVGRVPGSGVMMLDLPPGSHKVAVSKSGYASTSSRVWIRVGRTLTVKFRMRKIAEPTRPVVRPTPPGPVEPRKPDVVTPPIKPEPKKKKTSPKVWWQVAFYSSAGLAVVAAAVAIGTGIKVWSLEDDKKDHLKTLDPTTPWINDKNVCTSGNTDATLNGICNKGKNMELATNLMWGVAGVFAAAAGVFSYFAFVKKYPKETEQPAEGAGSKVGPSNISVTPEVWHRGAGIHARLRF